MKQMPNPETTRRLLFALLIMPLLAAAQVFDTTPPRIAHQPVRLGRVGKVLPIIANVSDNGGVKSVRITIQHDGQEIQHQMNQVKSESAIPVVVQTAAEGVVVNSLPGGSGKSLARLGAGEQLEVTLVRAPYYRIRTAAGVVGYVHGDEVQTVESGASYRVTLPAQLTAGGRLAYKIAAVDDFGNESQTDLIPVRLITDEELARLQSQKPGQTPSRPVESAESAARPGEPNKSIKSIFSRPVFWIATAAAGGGLYYFLSSGDEESSDKKASVGLVVGW